LAHVLFGKPVPTFPGHALMDVTPEALAEKFQLYSDDELLELFRSGDLTELAQMVARAELASRGIDPGQSTVPAPAEAEPEPVVEGDLVMVARMYNPLEAEMLRGRLESEGIPAMVADTQTAQVNPFYKLAIGGVRVMVPEAYLTQAREIVRADARGDYALDDSADVGPPTDNP
jgi:Putative prokaryotic signal transducing protein